MKIVKVSPKGQITIPKEGRKYVSESGQYMFILHGKTIILRPIKIHMEDELENFSALAEKSFDFWNDDADDVYQNFYNKNAE